MSKHSAFCPSCGAKTEVIDSRTGKDNVRRRRRCPKGCEVYTTREIPDAEYKLLQRYRRAFLAVKNTLNNV
jgi:transcriptional regulator NrdR family protein